MARSGIGFQLKSGQTSASRLPQAWQTKRLFKGLLLATASLNIRALEVKVKV
jgi:hypothetical protein